ncbi:DUF2087 domain-containing protein [Gracilibacillus salitolerans]|uniref:DUF2087 domain-containing protein n=1 Tax=Gracilibacillus salitolerans TaxID=2663022 RepID=A0A5Q2TPZ1_9BACI|nr:DUF2087 domain-containing protein [Gracilibacillus salitolerans]QGH37104.1 DUF2087 domain-containing protein [Gracilibacillus salitolerans]
MELSDMFWNASIEELKKGYIEEKNHFTCLLCGKEIEKGLVYSFQDHLYEAERYMRIHIESTHQSVFDYLIEMDRKLTGITDHQKNLLRLFYQGKSDKEIQEELNIGSTSTIRHHRFALKEKERQARNFLAMMELLKEKDKHAPAFIPIHQSATMVDDRYNITDVERAKIVDKFFPNGVENGLAKFPPKEKQRLVILREIAQQLDDNHKYTEKEMNQKLEHYYKDYVLVRRYLIDYGLLNRKQDGSQYWVKQN